MKPAIPALGLPLITVINKNKRAWENFFIVLTVIIGLPAQAFVFIMRGSVYQFTPLNSHLSFALWVAAIAPVILTVIIIRLRKEVNQNREYQESRIEKKILQLEAKALRAQMNPHLIFNCINSIKSLIQKNEQEKSILYLTTFSKLIRIVFQNSDKKEITLYDEIETCRLYTQLESMRFGNKLSYSFDVDETIDLKSVAVPALILQPFIENAIWHGIMPKEGGSRLTVKISKADHTISCIIDDDGIGRAVSMQNKLNSANSVHQSKGVLLTQTRLELSNVLNQRNATVEIIDKTNDSGEAAGTKVVLVFDEE